MPNQDRTSILTIYHNGDCSKSRATLSLIEASGKPFQIINYLETPPTPETLDRLLTLLGKAPEDIVRSHEDRYEELALALEPPSDRRGWIEVLCQNPILIERPIVTDGIRAVVGRPPENVLKLADLIGEQLWS